MSQSLLHLPTKGARLPLAFGPFAHPARICPRCAPLLPFVNSRQFATTRRNHAAQMQMQSPSRYDSKLPKRLSMKTQMKKMSPKQMGQDLGRIPSTLILPPAKDLPNWLGRDFVKRTKIHWLQLKTAVINWVQMVYYLKWDAPRDPITGKKNKSHLDLSARNSIARRLHNEFNSALDVGDIKRLQSITCDGLLAKARYRLERRRLLGFKREPWQILRYLGIKYPAFLERWPLTVLLPQASTRVVSDRLIALPFPDSYMRQCTVRIKSVQYYLPSDEWKYVTLSHTEYVVIQRLRMRGEEGEWMIWGIVEPSTIADIDKILQGKGESVQSTMMERVQNLMSGVRL